MVTVNVDVTGGAGEHFVTFGHYLERQPMAFVADTDFIVPRFDLLVHWLALLDFLLERNFRLLQDFVRLLHERLSGLTVVLVDKNHQAFLILVVNLARLHVCE